MITDFCDNVNELDEHLADNLELFNERFTDLLPVGKRFKRFSDYLGLKVWVFVFFVSIGCALNGCAINYLGVQISTGKIIIFLDLIYLFKIRKICFKRSNNKPNLAFIILYYPFDFFFTLCHIFMRKIFTRGRRVGNSRIKNLFIRSSCFWICKF